MPTPSSLNERRLTRCLAFPCLFPQRLNSRKIDWNLIPILSALYCISLIDRTNVSVARLLGMCVAFRSRLW